MTEFIASPRSYMALINNDRTIMMAPEKFRNPMVFLFVHHIIMSSWEMQFNNKSTLELYKIFCDFTNIYANKLLAVDWQIRWLRGIMLTRVFMNLATYNFCQICQLLTICDLWHCGHLATLYLWALYTFYCVIRQWILRNLRNNWPEFSIKILYRLTSRLTGIDFFSIKLVGCHPTTQSLWRQLLYEDLPGLVTRHACHEDSCHAPGATWHVSQTLSQNLSMYCLFWDLSKSEEWQKAVWFIFEYIFEIVSCKKLVWSNDV